MARCPGGGHHFGPRHEFFSDEYRILRRVQINRSSVLHRRSAAALRVLHANLAIYVGEEVQRLGGTSADQSLWLSTLTDAINMKVMIEDQLIDAQVSSDEEVQKNLNMEFLVTKTISNAEVWADLDAWAPSIKQEYEQLVNKRCAVRQLTKEQLRTMASELKLPIEVLPGKMVRARKSGTALQKQSCSLQKLCCS